MRESGRNFQTILEKMRQNFTARWPAMSDQLGDVAITQCSTPWTRRELMGVVRDDPKRVLSVVSVHTLATLRSG